MLDFLSHLFKRKGSSTTAKERLRLVLLSDHISLSPDTVEALKHELIDVISRYLKVDGGSCDVSFEQQAATVAMRANIPILGMQADRLPMAQSIAYAKSEARMSGLSMHASAGELPFLDDPDLHAPVSTAATATLSEEQVTASDAASAGAVNPSELESPRQSKAADTAPSNS
jgi:cell division topological specificity factor